MSRSSVIFHWKLGIQIGFHPDFSKYVREQRFPLAEETKNVFPHHVDTITIESNYIIGSILWAIIRMVSDVSYNVL